MTCLAEPEYAVDMVLTDFDGVLTNDKVLVLETGQEAVYCSRSDGMGCRLLLEAGLNVQIVSTETNPVVAARAKKLEVPVTQGVGNKGAVVCQVIEQHAIAPERVMFIGNDINDLAAFDLVGWAVAPRDAHPKVLSRARLVTKAKGGDGVLREIADLILGHGLIA